MRFLWREGLWMGILEGIINRDVQPRPFAKPPRWGSPPLRGYLCSYSGRSLRGDVWMKIRASTIFIQTSPLAELVT